MQDKIEAFLMNNPATLIVIPVLFVITLAVSIYLENREWKKKRELSKKNTQLALKLISHDLAGEPGME